MLLCVPFQVSQSATFFIGSNTDLSIDGEIERDIQTADEIYWIVAFVRFSGVRIFENALREFLAKLMQN